MWFRNKSFQEEFNTHWPSELQGVPIRVQLNECAANINEWNTKSFGSVQSNLKRLRKDLEWVKKKVRNEENVVEENKIMNELDEWRFREELLWKQRSRVDWLKEGDKNTKFFHAKATHRRKINSIKGLQTSDGSWVTKEKDMVNIALEHIKGVFKSSRNGPINLNFQMSHIEGSLSVESLSILNHDFSASEVREAIFQMFPTKAPGPDGFSAIFYQKLWNIVGVDITRATLKMLNDCHMGGIGDTVICLIPKSSGAVKVDDFRPISLCNVTSKLISKVLANRLKRVLPEVVTECQGAFVPGRLITDNFILAHEVGHYIRSGKGSRSGYLSLKTDMCKAYDRVEWDFIEDVQLHMGFSRAWLVMECVSTVSYRIKLNGVLSDSFLPSRGLRQGNPLSPYLFILCANWLSKTISGNVNMGRLQGVIMGRGAPEISHLFFADDSIFFMKANFQNVVVFKEILERYQVLPRQKINYQKSKVVYSKNVTGMASEFYTETFGVRKVTHHTKYLGLPIYYGGRKSKLFQFLVDRICSRVSGWTSNTLSAAGKEILIKSVLQAVPQYVMMVFKLPKNLCKRMASVITKFWWSHNRKNPFIGQTSFCYKEQKRWVV